MLESPPLHPLAFVDAFAPGIKLHAELLIFLFNQFHVEGTRQVLFFFVPFVKGGIYDCKIQSEITEL